MEISPPHSKYPVPELLAPAGDATCLRAAVANGADAVYFGLESFNARRRATNFTLESLPEVVEYLHGRNVRAYVAFNTLIFPLELPEAARFIAGIAAAGADAVIVQDLGLVPLIRRMVPSLPVHASTQATQTHPAGIEFLRRLGVSRVILARELSIADIGAIARAAPIELEVFVHGALCISYSGQCLASESLWGRSANRGECAQACRLPWQLVVDGRTVDTREAEYLLSPRDLCTWDRVGDLMRAGVRSLKIEGRLKDAAYVAAATRLYRSAIDAAAEGRRLPPETSGLRELEQTFSRGFTHGFLDGPCHQELVEGRAPGRRGVEVGTIVRTGTRGVIVALGSGPHAEIRPGDGIVFDGASGEIGGRVYSAGAAGSGDSRLVAVGLGPNGPARGDVRVGAIVWKTDDPQVRKAIESTWSRDVTVRRAPVDLQAQLLADGRLRVCLWDEHGHESEAVTREPLAAAHKHPVTPGLLREQFARLGETPFELRDVELSDVRGPVASLPVMAPRSVLNALRRRTVDMLLARRLESARHGVVEPDALGSLRREMADHPVREPTADVSVHVLIRRAAQLDVVLAWQESCPGGLVHLDCPDPRENIHCLERVRAAGGLGGLATPRILAPGEDLLVRRLLDAAPDAILVRNLAALQQLATSTACPTLIADHSMNIANELAAGLLARSGITRLTPGCDLNAAEIEALARGAAGATLEVIIHQHVPMFHMAYCVLAARVSRGDACADCGRPCRRHEARLRDRLGFEHLLEADSGGRTTAYSARVQTGASDVQRLCAAGVRELRIELLDESPDAVHVVLDAYSNVIAGTLDPAAALRRLGALYPAGVTRGTFGFD